MNLDKIQLRITNQDNKIILCKPDKTNKNTTEFSSDKTAEVLSVVAAYMDKIADNSEEEVDGTTIIFRGGTLTWQKKIL
jgi:hypothetical protein